MRLGQQDSRKLCFDNKMTDYSIQYYNMRDVQQAACIQYPHAAVVTQFSSDNKCV
jgi:hypothetical protein